MYQQELIPVMAPGTKHQREIHAGHCDYHKFDLPTQSKYLIRPVQSVENRKPWYLVLIVYSVPWIHILDCATWKLSLHGYSV